MVCPSPSVGRRVARGRLLPFRPARPGAGSFRASFTPCCGSARTTKTATGCRSRPFGFRPWRSRAAPAFQTIKKDRAMFTLDQAASAQFDTLEKLFDAAIKASEQLSDQLKGVVDPALQRLARKRGRLIPLAPLIGR